MPDTERIIEDDRWRVIRRFTRQNWEEGSIGTQIRDLLAEYDALVALYEADDPEPPYWMRSTHMRHPLEAPAHITWRKRQEIKAAAKILLDTNRRSGA